MMPTRKYYNPATGYQVSLMTSSITTGWKKQTLPHLQSMVVESDKDYKVEVAVPGMTKEDFNIHLGDENESGHLHGKRS